MGKKIMEVSRKMSLESFFDVIGNFYWAAHIIDY